MNTYRGIFGILLIVASIFLAFTNSNTTAIQEITFSIMGVGGLILIGQITDPDKAIVGLRDLTKAKLLLDGAPPDLLWKIGKEVNIKKDAKVYADQAGTDIINVPQRNGMLIGYKGEMLKIWFSGNGSIAWINRNSIN